MSQDEEIESLRQENRELKERVAHLEALVQKLQEQMAKEEVSELRTRPGKLIESGKNPFQNERACGDNERK